MGEYQREFTHEELLARSRLIGVAKQERDAELDRLRDELAAMTKRAETAEDTVGCQTDLEKDFATTRAELALMERQRDHHAQLLDKSDAENWKLKTELATARAELAAKDARVIEVHAQAERLGGIATNQAEVIETLRKRVGELEVEAFDRIWKHAKDTARAEQAEARIAELNND